MILNLLDPVMDFSLTILRECNRYGLHQPVIDEPEINSVIVVPEGTPENIALTLITNHLNGLKIISIIKPRIGTGLGAIPHLPRYIDSPYIENVVLIVDKDFKPIRELLEFADRTLSEIGFVREEVIDEYIYRYAGSRGPRTITLDLVFNCFESIGSNQNTIEDHFLIAGDVACNGNSKDTWNGLSSSERRSIIDRLAKGGTGVLRRSFPQHYKVLELLYASD